MKFNWQRVGAASLALMLGPAIALAHPAADHQLLPFAMIHDAVHQLVRLPGSTLFVILLVLLAVLGFRVSRRSGSPGLSILVNHSGHEVGNADSEPSP